MDKPIITLQCPHCRNHAQEQFARANVNDKIVTCLACSRSGDAAEFIDAASRKRILEASKKAAVDAFKRVPGFKPRR